MDHKDDIHCLAIDPTGTLIATGEIGKKPLLCVWNCQTMEVVSQFKSQLTKGIMQICWSPDGRYVAASDQSTDHCVGVWDMKASDKKTGVKGSLVAFGKGDKANVLSIGFNSQSNALYLTCVKK